MKTETLAVGSAAVFLYPSGWNRVTVYKLNTAGPWTLDGHLTPVAGMLPTVTPAAGATLVTAADTIIRADRLVLGASGISALADVADVPDVVLVTAADDDGYAFASTAYRVQIQPDGVEALIARDEAYRDVLVTARREAADTLGIVELELPDGRHERYANTATLNRAIAELDARLALLRAARSGAQFAGQTYR